MSEQKSKNIIKVELEHLSDVFNSDESVRLREIIDVFTKHNVLFNLAKHKNPDQVRQAFEELGPTFIKIGQILSVRPDIVPADFALEFKKLQSHVKTDDFSVIRPIIEENTGIPMKQLFAEFDEKPLASASIAQVHTAKLIGGKKVVVKVQHPRINEEITRDLALLEKAIPLMDHIHKSETLSPAAMLAELKRSLMLELDFTKEADNIELFYKNNNGGLIISPQVYKQYSTKELLVMDFMKGMPIADYIDKANDEISKGNTGYTHAKKRLANILVTNYMKQVFDDGYFHADPHPGNLLVSFTDINASDDTDLPKSNVNSMETTIETALFEYFNLFSVETSAPQQEDDGREKISYVDFGMMGRLDEGTMDKMNRVVAALSEQDSEKISKALLNLCKTSGSVDMDKLNQDVSGLFSEYFEMSIGDMSLPAVLKDVRDVCTKNHLQLPANITLLFKGIGTIEGLILQLDPELSLMTAVEPYAKRYIMKQADPKTEIMKFFKTLEESALSIPQVPIKLAKLLDKMSEGKFAMSMDHKNLHESIKSLQSMINRLAISIIVAALIIGSSMLVKFNASIAQTAVSSLGIIGFSAAVILSAILLFQHFKKEK